MRELRRKVIAHKATGPLTREEENSPSHDDPAVTKKPALSDEKIYEETAKVVAIFWEWRDKTLNRFFAVTGGVIAFTTALIQHAEGIRIWHFIPLLAGSVYSFISFLLDTRHKDIFVEGYSIAADIELKDRDNGAIYRHIGDLHKKPRSLTKILRFIYLGSTVLFLALTIVVILLATFQAAP